MVDHYAKSSSILMEFGTTYSIFDVGDYETKLKIEKLKIIDPVWWTKILPPYSIIPTSADSLIFIVYFFYYSKLNKLRNFLVEQRKLMLITSKKRMYDCRGTHEY